MFLDIDGVLAVGACSLQKGDPVFNAYPYDKKCVAVFNEILDTVPNLQIILSSDWRIHYSLMDMHDIFQMNGIKRSPVGFTRVLETKFYPPGDELAFTRQEEIQIWLREHDKNDRLKWVAVDDLNMTEWLGENFIHCKRWLEGIKQTGIKEKIIKKLTC